ncbi:MAG: vitamin B12-dependent ribonucleotide reductase [Candidatus Stahlbacteria bacterium]|nr:MAG: vitamin B12-dependent ribonucleotide reductase [Candidatus Stahlbacteria bacterium]
MNKAGPAKIRKRDGRVVDFDTEKITNAIFKAAQAVGGENRELAETLAQRVVDELIKHHGDTAVPTVEEVQDIVETVLIRSGHAKTAKAYILYRRKRAELREAKQFFVGIQDDLKLSLNALKVLERRYLLKNEEGEVHETPAQLFKRVARAIAAPDERYGGDVARTEERFYNLMTSFEFMPNSPTLMNAGTELGQLAACFVLPVDDEMERIFESVKHAAIIHKTGGGTGFSFSRIRPKNDMVHSTGGIASGPVSFMRVFDVATEVIKQGGRRRGANMGILRVDHPDILEFITCKESEGILANFNISVGVTEEFMHAVQGDENYSLKNPRTSKETGRLRAKDVFNLMVTMAWRTGDPGIIFLDRINHDNPTPSLGSIEATNPCGEQPLLPYEACNLGSVNLSKMVTDHQVDYDHLRKTIHTAIHFLDNVIDAGRYPLPEIDEMVRRNRKIGLGVMGWADMLFSLAIPYDSDEALGLAEQVIGFIQTEAVKASQGLANSRGAFPSFPDSTFARRGEAPRRNATLTTIAPTGTISIIAGCSSGIEPIFAISFIRNVMDNTELLEVNPVFERLAREMGFYNEGLIKEIARHGTVAKIPKIPDSVKRIFVTAHDINPSWHVKMQAAFQKHTDNAVSKTVNLPNHATPMDVADVYMLAYRLGCKGVTVYRDGSKSSQVLNIGSVNREQLPAANRAAQELSEYRFADRMITVGSEFTAGCNRCNS